MRANVSATEPVRVLGVDTSLRSSGVGVVEARGNAFSVIEHGKIKIQQRRPLSECLRRIHEDLTAVIERTSPQAVAIEGIFYCKNVRTAIVLGEARGVVIAVAAVAGLPVYEYAARKVKKAIVGNGAATKEQVRRMVCSLTGLEKEPEEDAGDALAIALCHFHNRTAHEMLAPKEL
jgi:crossover junction endodeoxyribonuclease RuvC